MGERAERPKVKRKEKGGSAASERDEGEKERARYMEARRADGRTDGRGEG